MVTLLRASHIKPWAECSTDDERLDVFNGLLLAPHIDALFDVGWISFCDDGHVLVSNRLEALQQAKLGIESSWGISGLAEEQHGFLAYHRNQVFKQ